jgi:hypothetical protein
MNRFLKHWRLTGRGELFHAHLISRADDYMRQQRLARHAAIDWPLRRRRLHDGAFATLVCHSIGFADGTLGSLARQP